MGATRRSWSIESKLPALIGGLLLLAVGIYGTLAYRAVSRAAVSAAFARLRTVAGQFATPMESQFRTRAAGATAAARDPAVIAFFSDPTAIRRAGAAAVLAALGTDTAQTAAVELRARDGRLMAAHRERPAGAPDPGASAPPRPDSSAISPMFQHRDSVFYEQTAPVRLDGRVAGHVVLRRRFLATPQAVQTFARLIGDDAELLVGNADGSLWTDLRTRVERPPPITEGWDGRVYERDGRTRLGGATAVRGTPFVVALEFPRDQVLSRARALLSWFAALGLGVGAFGTAAGWALSRRLTLPLRELTLAADGIAAGDYARRPAVAGDDEIGRLAEAFRHMADHIRGEQHRLEEQVARRTRELESAMRRLQEAQDELVRKERLAILGQLSSGVGHELRNPLGVMTNAIYFLEATQSDAPPKVREYLGILRGQIRLSEKVVNDLLDFARVKTPQRSLVQLDVLVGEQLGRVSIPPRIRVERDFPPALPAVQVDPVQVGQVVLNLVVNAVQAMGDTGGLLILSARGREGHVQMEVRDTGPGIPPENLGRIFEPLFTTKARGIGLGLAVSRILARANGGDITVTSEPGRGAAFMLALPAASEAGLLAASGTA